MAKRTRLNRKPVKRAKSIRYRVQNWHTYEQALVRRGSVTVWFDPQLLERWRRSEQPRGKRGAP